MTATPTRPPARSGAVGPPADRGKVLWFAAIAVVVVLGVIAVVLSRGSGGDDPVEGQTAPVTVTEADGGSVLPVLSDPTDDPAVGMTIPTVTGSTFGGDPITIGPDGKAKIIMFVAHWCPHCRREVPVIVDHLKDSPLPDDVELVTVSTDVKANAVNYPPSSWLEDEDWPAPVLADSDASAAAAAFGLASFPFFVVADADGKVVFRTSGELSTQQFDLLVQAAQTGETPT